MACISGDCVIITITVISNECEESFFYGNQLVTDFSF